MTAKIKICDGNTLPTILEVEDVEWFPPKEWDGKEDGWQLSSPNCKSWVTVNRDFIELLKKLPRMKEPCLPTSVEFLRGKDNGVLEPE